MKTQPYVPPAAQSLTDSISITDEFIVRSVELKKESRLLAPAALLLMTQHIIANQPFEAWPVDNSYQITFADTLFTAPLSIRDAVASISSVLASTLNALYDSVLADLKTMQKEAQQNTAEIDAPG